jgi:hypothetical protein
MFVPEPVISLSIRPEGNESPNFSRALNRFQKEDPTFRVHVDSESQEVSQVPPHSLPASVTLKWTLTSRRQSFPAWASFTSTSTLSA